MNGHSVSIALATFNGQKYLRTQLASFSSQSYLPSELVITDDASTDQTVSIVQEFARSAPFPVRLIENSTRLGYAANFLKAASACRSDLIAFSDQDDIWHDDKLELMISTFDTLDILLAHHNARVVINAGDVIGTLVVANSFLISARRPWAYSQGFTQVFRRELLEPIRQSEYLDGRIPHDTILFFLAAQLGSVRFVNKCLVDYRQHGANVFGWSKSIKLK